MTFLGADTESLRACSETFRGGSRRIQEQIDTVGSHASAVAWEGPDAEAFRAAARQAILLASELAGRVEERSRELADQAEQQDQASGDDAGGSGGGGPEDAGRVEDPGDTDGTVPLDEDIPEDDDSVHPDNSAQGSIGDCFLLSTLGSIGDLDPDLMQENVDEVDPGVYEVTLYDENGDPIVYEVVSTPEDGVRDSDGDQNLYSVYERAYQMHLQERGEDLNGGRPEDAMQTITGQEANGYGGEDRPSVEQMEQLLENGRPVNADTGGVDDPSHDDIAGNHAYTVTGVDAEAGTVTVTNPWGSDASLPQTVEMSYDEYLETFPYTSVGRTEERGLGGWIGETLDGTAGL